MRTKGALEEEEWRRGWESNPRMKVLQTSPFPLGYRAGEISIAKRKLPFSSINCFSVSVVRAKVNKMVVDEGA